ncbi:hypothetical protein ACVWZK_007353 [Bradyrhizobium sp. GM0.4]
MRSVAQRSAFADIADRGADLVGVLREAEGRDESHHEGHGEGAGEVADEDEAPVAQDATDGDAGAFVDQGERGEHEHAGQEVEAQQIQHDEADREQQRADQRLPRVHVDRDGEPCRERQDGAGHVGADDGIPGGHEDFGLARIHHLGDEFRRREIRHRWFLLLPKKEISPSCESD